MTKATILDLDKVEQEEKSGSIFCLRGSQKFDSVPELEDGLIKAINYEVREELLKLPEQKLDGQSFLRALGWNNTSIWFYHKFRLYFDVRNVLYDIRRIEILAEKFDSLLIITEQSLFKEYNFPNHVVVEYRPRKNRINKVALFNFLFTSFLRLLLGWVNQKTISNKTVLIDNRASYRHTLSSKGTTAFLNSYFFELSSLFKKSELINLDILPIPKFDKVFPFSWKNIIAPDDRHRIFEESILFRGWFSASVNQLTESTSSTIKSQLESAKETVSFTSIQKLFIARLLELQPTTRLYLKKYFCYDKYLNRKRPKKIVGIDEYSPNMRLIHESAKQNGSTSIGVQHGTMHELHPGYLYSTIEMDMMPIPNKTLVWGDRWKRFLTSDGNYPPDRLSIVGQLRTDLISTLPESEHKDQLVVLFASQPQRDFRLRRLTAESVFKAAKQFTNCTLILKPHPLETDLDYYRQIADKCGCQNYEIDQKTDLYVLLKKCDVLITSFSTVGTEAVYFKKPLIIFDPLDQDVMKYMSDGVGLQAKNAFDIEQHLQHISDGKIVVSPTSQNIFISENAYKIDGNVGNRVVQEISLI
ncbi:MAG: CDP-glycerol glycerophosphotransferase family protein [Reichenbachiella sp.]|uniref:CDP-glycerol glycerophosphotransferase family protein n=1 Tax=Reichenbachiella sp. TaxID=2184521 RepID=UPI0032646150